jgi:integron integrase
MEAHDKRSPFLESARAAVRVRNYSYATEQTYVDWVKTLILFHKKRHAAEMVERRVGAYLSYLAVDRNVSASTQNQALNALVFLYNYVIERPLEQTHGVVRAKQGTRLPVVLSPEEVAAVFLELTGIAWLISCLQYGSGLRLKESLRIRVKDLDFTHPAIVVRDGKGGKDRVVTLTEELILPLQRHLEHRKTLFERDVPAGCGTVFLPNALARKYPNAPSEWGWQYVFPATKISSDPRSGAR